MSQNADPDASRDYLNVMYDKSIRPVTSYPKKMAAHLYTEYEMAAGMRFLDVGCGRGEFLRSFGDLGLDTSGVDASEHAGGLAPNARILCVDLERQPLPFGDDVFDVVFSKSVLEHLTNPLQLLSEQLRVLKPGGVLINMTPAWEYQFRIFYDDFTHKSPFTRKSLQVATTAAGFAEVSSGYFRQLPSIWAVPALVLLAELTRLLTPTRVATRSKWVRFSKELMVLCSARKIGATQRFDAKLA